MTVNVITFYQNLSVIWSKFYYSNMKYQFYVTPVLLSLRHILHLRKTFKHFTKSGDFYNKWNPFNSSNFEFKHRKSLLQEYKASSLYSLGPLGYLRKIPKYNIKVIPSNSYYNALTYKDTLPWLIMKPFQSHLMYMGLMERPAVRYMGEQNWPTCRSTPPFAVMWSLIPLVSA